MCISAQFCYIIEEEKAQTKLHPSPIRDGLISFTPSPIRKFLISFPPPPQSVGLLPEIMMASLILNKNY